MKTDISMKFSEAPTHSKLWDACVHEFLYKREGKIEYFDGLDELLQKEQVTRILDVCSGSGFPSLELRARGYQVDCAEISEKEREAFKENARKLGVSDAVYNIPWNTLPKELKANSYDLVMCRGSVWYAAGGYCDEQFTPKKDELHSSLNATISSFAKMVKPGGALYVDKYKDDDKDHFDKVADILVGDEVQEVYFKMTRTETSREGSMIRKLPDGTNIGERCSSYPLLDSELEDHIRHAGLVPVRTPVRGEHYFNVWLGKKPEK